MWPLRANTWSGSRQPLWEVVLLGEEGLLPVLTIQSFRNYGKEVKPWRTKIFKYAKNKTLAVTILDDQLLTNWNNFSLAILWLKLKIVRKTSHFWAIFFVKLVKS